MSTAPKKLTTEQRAKCSIVTPEFRVSYPHLFKPQAVNPDDTPRYSITMLFKKNQDMKPITAAIRNAKLAFFGSKEEWPANLISPVRDGDGPDFIDEATGKTKEGYAGCWVISASAKEDKRPAVLSTKKDAAKKWIPIEDAGDIAPGCYARALVYACGYNYMKKRGVTFKLDMVQKIKDGPALGTKRAAEDVFTPMNAGDEDDAGDEGMDDFA